MLIQDGGKQSLKPGQLNGEKQRNLVNFLLVLQHSRYSQMQSVWLPCLTGQAEKLQLELKDQSLECSIWISPLYTAQVKTIQLILCQETRQIQNPLT